MMLTQPQPESPMTPEPDELLDGVDDCDVPRARAGRRNLREKLVAGLSGWKHAIRGDSSFFAHGYRVLLVALTAAMLGVGPQGWIVLVMAACSIFIAELNHSAIDTLARAIGDPDEPRLKVAREIAAGGVLVAVVGSAIVVGVILVLQFGDLLGWSL
ncbi:diacylglycerol kinase [Tundrisphaera lichenicola]|uniref:diacylglycerol kinase n=1 Tax=Tundrisphaera lichenicola TaxID=2029860 RepID=UPI003EBACCA6